MNLSKLLVAFCVAALSTSCVNTDIVESAEPQSNETSLLVVNIDTPEPAFTRADQDYKLRYVAKLYQGGRLNSFTTFVERKEIAGDDLSERNNKNQIIFKVEPETYYSLQVFADYVPKDYQQSNNCYKDYFYNTSVSSGYEKYSSIEVYPTPGGGSKSFSTAFFNNDNYDCFFASTSFYKGVEEENVNLELKRTASLVRVEDTSGNIGGVDIKITGIELRDAFDMESAVSAYPNSYSPNVTLSKNVTSSDPNLFYFYTLCDALDSNKYVALKFTVTKDGETKTYNITQIPVKANYKTVVKGEFVSGSTQQQPGGDTNPPSTEGDIVLNLSASTGWEQSEMTKQ